ncbi:MAG TPA: recombinase family protein [Pyrinomonadaceae bacterium]|nr:recombinase family protein [Pyrinomonadaceae bacterium]
MKKIKTTQGSGQALVYCRVSTSKQEEKGTSLDSQAAACIARAEELGFKVGRVTKEVYSGAEIYDRQLLSADRADIRAGKFQALVVYAIDRLSRDVAHLCIIADECERAGAQLIFVTEDLDRSAEGKLMQSVRAYVAEVERQKIRERCVRGKRQKALSGRVVRGGTDLYGYGFDAERGVRTVNNVEAATVRQIFRWAAEGVSTRSIINRLRQQGTPPPSAGKRRLVHERYSATPAWGSGAVKRILNDPTYKGEAYAWRWQSAKGKKATVARPADEWIRLPDDAAPAIVTPELWTAAQERLKANRGDYTRNELRPDLLRGHVFCGKCGLRMRGDNEHGRRVYRCPSRFAALGDCRGARIPSVECENAAWELVKKILDDPTVLTTELERRKAEGSESRARLEADAESARRSHRQAEAELQKIVDRAATADDDLWAMFQKAIAEKKITVTRLKEAVDDAEARLASADADAASLTALTEYAARVRKHLAVFGFDEKRLAFEALNVKVNGNGRDWRIDVCPPNTGLVSQSYCSSARPAQARRCSRNVCRRSSRRSNSRPRSN